MATTMGGCTSRVLCLTSSGILRLLVQRPIENGHMLRECWVGEQQCRNVHVCGYPSVFQIIAQMTPDYGEVRLQDNPQITD